MELETTLIAARKDGNDNCVETIDSIFSMAASQAPVFAGVNENQPTDCDANTGSIEVLVQSSTADGDTIEYELRNSGGGVVTAWNHNNTFTGVAPGNYTIHVRFNAVGGGSESCEVSFPGGAEINGISDPTTNAPVVNNATDCTETDGDISIAASSIDGFALEYRLINVDESDTTEWGSQNVFVGLSPDSFHIEVRNAGTTNCISSVSGLKIERPDSITLSPAAHEDIAVCGEETGEITLSGASSGTSTLEYSIDGGATWSSNPVFGNLAPGTYNGSIRNQGTQTCETPYGSAIEITRPEDIVMINPTKTDETDCGASDGTVEVQLASFDNDSTLTFEVNGVIQPGVETFTGLGQGTYNVKAYYADGVSCRDSIDVTIDGRTAITATAAAFDSEVCGAEEGQIVVNVTDSPDGAVEFSIDTGTTWQASNVFANLGEITTTPIVRYADEKCPDTLGALTLTLPEPTVIPNAAIDTVSASQCGVDDAKILIDTNHVSFGGSDFEFSIDGVTFQEADSFVNLTGGSYLVTVRNASVPSCFDTVSVLVPDNTAPRLNARVYLQGAFNTGTGIMNDDLRAKGLIPASSPYGSTNLTTLGVYTGTETSNGATPHHNDIQLINDPEAGNDHAGATLSVDYAEVTADRAANSVVDWILVELRPSQDSAFIKSRSVGMVQRDGDIVTWKDGVSDMLFRGVCASTDTTSYFVSIKHRNHAGVMTLEPVDFTGGVVNLDFTSTDLQLYKLPGLAVPQEPSAVLPNGKRALWGGNVAFNRRVLFQGAADDPTLISNVVLSHPDNDGADEQLRNFIANGYYNSDVNLDGVTIFQGAPNDVDIIFFNIMANPDNTQFNRNFALREQLPGND